MLPSLSPLSGNVLAGNVVAVPAPPHFRPIQMPVKRVQRIPALAMSEKEMTPAQRLGVHYEQKWHAFAKEFIRNYVESPCLMFEDGGGTRVVIPDGYAYCDTVVWIFEVKHQHTSDAWWQLEKLYKPVVEHFVKCPAICVEVCKTYDPAMPFPISPTLVDLDTLSGLRPGEFGVLKWKP